MENGDTTLYVTTQTTFMNGSMGGSGGSSGDEDNTVVIVAIVATALVVLLVSCGVICLLYSKDNKVSKPQIVEIVESPAKSPKKGS